MRSILLSLLFLWAGLSGCSPVAHVRSADSQVDEILRDRRAKVLDYQPQVSVATTCPTEATARLYEKLPVTVMPPPAPSPIEVRRPVLHAEPEGPGLKWRKAPPVDRNVVNVDTAPPVPGRGGVMGPPAPGPRPLRLGLFECIAYGVEHSRAYRDRMDDLYLAALDVTLQRHLFSPRPFAQLGYTYDGGQADVDYRSALTATATAGVRQKLPYGGEIVARALTRFVSALNDNATEGESAEIALSATIPLLRGAGMVNLEPLISGERQVVYQVRAFETFRRSFAVEIASGFFRLQTLQQSVNNRRRNLANLTALTAQMRALYAADRLNFLQVQQSLQAQLAAQSALLDAMDTHSAAMDDFKLALGMPTSQPLELAAVEMNAQPPRIQENEAIALAHRYRLDHQTARDRMDDALRAVQVAQNGLLPDLNLVAGSTVGNRSGDPARSLDSRTLTYSAGVTLDLPVDRVAERNRHRASLILLDAASRNCEQEGERIANDVRDGLRAIRNAETNLLIQQRGIELAERRLEFANELFRAGRPGVSARDAVEAQSSLLDAQDRYARARSQLQIRILEYLRDTGLLRLDPGAGSLGVAMDRGRTARPSQNN